MAVDVFTEVEEMGKDKPHFLNFVTLHEFQSLGMSLDGEATDAQPRFDNFDF